jgi:hypothetical protein
MSIFFKNFWRADNCCAACRPLPCDPCVDECTDSYADTYTITVGADDYIVYRSPTHSPNTAYTSYIDTMAPCFWQWIGDAATSTSYDSGGEDAINLGLAYHAGTDTWKWAITFYSTVGPVETSPLFKDDVTGDPIGTYDTGIVVSA